MVSFIIIDDSELDCFVSRKVIELADESLAITTFNNAQYALDFMREDQPHDANPVTVVLLDLLMPIMDGFQFADEFEKLPQEIQKNYMIIVMSSTMDHGDIRRILSYSTINSFIEKPFSRKKLDSILRQVSPAI